MDEKLEYSEEIASEAETKQWSDIPSKASTVSQTFKNILPKDCLLSYIPEGDDTRSKRTIIPSTRLERLSYFRSFVSTPSKTQIVCMQHVRFNRFLWYYIFNVFFKSLPHTFVYIFLASYAPDEHFFLTKMLPICSGFSLAYIIAAILDMTAYIDTVIRLLDYSIRGLLYKTPWNRCPVKSYQSSLNITIHCYNIEEFIKKFNNDTAVTDTVYIASDGEYFQMAPVLYYGSRISALLKTIPYGYLSTIYFLIIWTIVALHHNQLFKRYIWKTLNGLQMFIIIIYIMVFVHLYSVYLFTHFGHKVTDVVHDEIQNILWKADVDMLAESMTAPPAVHILTARSSQEIQPTRDSTLIILSNAIFYILRGLLSYRLKKFCESLINSPILITDFNQDSSFFFWPMYFSTFYLGEFYSTIFFILHFLMELYTVIVTYQCLVEAIVCEWRLAKRVAVTITVWIIGFVWFALSDMNERIIFYILSKGIVTMMEVIGIYVIYPVGRLIDDVTFFEGVKPTKMRTLNLRFVPIFYGIKLFTMIDALLEVAYKIEYTIIIKFFYLSTGVFLLTILIGVVHSSYVYIWKKKESWTSLFRPDDKWGPPFNTRQLRKQYESRQFVGSQAPRLLSRYILRKSESKVYSLDITYDTYEPTTSYETRTENEKKSV
ncbi:unnamed protein product [Chilo suppressalis]|uniref:Uncharacterized protein n=1 Tax=Chilo suppressalis TaxID=168631 RepID=A0ABN8BD45_CHISP|nr:unnamed protein product [Chilo suppressalis]